MVFLPLDALDIDGFALRFAVRFAVLDVADVDGVDGLLTWRSVRSFALRFIFRRFAKSLDRLL